MDRTRTERIEKLFAAMGETDYATIGVWRLTRGCPTRAVVGVTETERDPSTGTPHRIKSQGEDTAASLLIDSGPPLDKVANLLGETTAPSYPTTGTASSDP